MNDPKPQSAVVHINSPSTKHLSNSEGLGLFSNRRRDSGKVMDAQVQSLVSVVTPVYNGEKYLAECIERVLSQTCQYSCTRTSLKGGCARLYTCAVMKCA